MYDLQRSSPGGNTIGTPGVIQVIALRTWRLSLPVPFYTVPVRYRLELLWENGLRIAPPPCLPVSTCGSRVDSAELPGRSATRRRRWQTCCRRYGPLAAVAERGAEAALDSAHRSTVCDPILHQVPDAALDAVLAGLDCDDLRSVACRETDPAVPRAASRRRATTLGPGAAVASGGFRSSR